MLPGNDEKKTFNGGRKHGQIICVKPTEETKIEGWYAWQQHIYFIGCLQTKIWFLLFFDSSYMIKAPIHPKQKTKSIEKKVME